MRTEQDLRTALATREDLVPDLDPVMAGARAAAIGYRRRRAATTVGTIAAAAVAVGALLTVPALFTDGSAGSRTPTEPATAPAEPPALVPFDPADPRPPYAFTIYPGTVAGFEIHPTNVAPEYQIARILQPGEPESVADLVVYQPDPGIEVGGPGELLLRWEYTPDGYAEIYGPRSSVLDEETLQQLADGLQFTAPYPVRLPYRLDYLPAGATPFNVFQDTVNPRPASSSIQLGRRDESDPLIFDIHVADGPSEIDDPSWDWQPTTVGGRPAQCVDLVDGRRCMVELDEFTVSVGSGSLEPEELDQLIAGLHPATLDDPSTWYEIDEALPGE